MRARETPKRLLSTWLGERFPKRFAQALLEWYPDSHLAKARWRNTATKRSKLGPSG
ncbi:hypothetical protein HAALTHF_46090n [Vreelandella aquamarina]|nr:hypothetical protein HAALTHF_46090n [Halomonas axialensis]